MNCFSSSIFPSWSSKLCDPKDCGIVLNVFVVICVVVMVNVHEIYIVWKANSRIVLKEPTLCLFENDWGEIMLLGSSHSWLFLKMKWCNNVGGRMKSDEQNLHQLMMLSCDRPNADVLMKFSVSSSVEKSSWNLDTKEYMRSEL